MILLCYAAFVVAAEPDATTWPLSISRTVALKDVDVDLDCTHFEYSLLIGQLAGIYHLVGKGGLKGVWKHVWKHVVPEQFAHLDG